MEEIVVGDIHIKGRKITEYEDRVLVEISYLSKAEIEIPNRKRIVIVSAT